MAHRFKFPSFHGAEAPLFPAGLAFAAGILLAAQVTLPVGVWVGLAGTAWLGAWLSGLFPARREAGPGWVTGMLVAGIFLAGGGCQAVGEAGRARDSLRGLYECGFLVMEEPVELTGVVAQAPELAADRIYLHLEMEQARSLRRSARVRGVVRVVVPFSDPASRLEYDAIGIGYGVRLRMIAQLRLRRQYRNPGAPPFDEILASQGIVATGVVRSPLLIERLAGGESGGWRGWLYGVRAEAIRVCLRHFGQPAAGLLVAALFGNRYFLSWETAESFRIGGTFHLLVISGLHMAMIAVVVQWVMRRLVGSRFWQYGCGLLVMWGYALMVGAQPAVARSVVMLTLVMAGQYLFRTLNGANSLAAAGLIMLAWEPGDLFNPGFQVSFLTVGAMVFLTGPWWSRLREIGRWRPRARTPWPPRAPAVRWLAEVLFWDDWRFRRERRRERVRYRLFKARASFWVSRLRIQSLLVWVTMTMTTTIGVQVGLLPVMIAGFHRVSLLSPLINVVEAVLVTGLMAAGVLYLGLGLLIGRWVAGLAPAIDWLGRATVEAGAAAASWPGGGWRVADYGEAAWIPYGLYWGGVAGLIWMLDGWNPLGGVRERWWRVWMAAMAGGMVLVVGLVLILHPTGHDFERGRLSLTFLDVGQGDAVVIAFPGGRLMMVDSGGDLRFQTAAENGDEGEPFIEDRLGIAEAAVLPYLWHRGIDRLDWIVASHGDTDHVGGFRDLVRNMEVGEAWQAPGEQGEFTGAMRAAGIPVRELGAGCRMEIDGVLVEALAGGGPGNNGSLVLRLSWKGRSVLLTGDIEREAERGLIGAGIDLRAEVLKVAHHGSRTSSTAEFLDRVGPERAIISAGFANPYGHPHEEVVERLRQRGIRVDETSRVGAVTLSTGGEGWRER